LFFENQGQMQFKASTFSTSEQGKWLVMDIGDLDGDQKPDIVLGSFFKPGLGQGKVGDSNLAPAVVWLKNTSPIRKK
jgi:hypothetical protein